MEAREIAADIVRKALNRGCEAAEVFIKSSQGISVEAMNGRVEAMEVSRGFGLSLKVVKGRKLGFAFMTVPAGIGSCRGEIDRTIDEAVQGSEWTADDEYAGIPGYMPSGEVLILDEKIKDIDERDVIRDALLLEDSSLSYDERVKKVRKAGVSAGSGETVIVNSRGVSAAYEATYYSAHVTAIATDEGGDSQMGWDYAGSRRLSDIDIKSVGEGASKRALELLGSVKISPVKIPVILAPFVAVEFLGILSASLSAEAVQKQRSFLAGKSGRRVVSPLIDIIDDGTMDWRTGTRPVDDEGVPVANKTLISGGVLNGFIHNTYTAARDNTVSTGNAARASFKSLPGIDVTNLYIKPGSDKSGDDIVKSLSRGILILGAMGVHTANPVSGDFSVGISGRWIEKGETVYPVKEAVISGNILDLFRKVEAIGNDLRFYGNIGSPTLLIGDMDVSA